MTLKKILREIPFNYKLYPFSVQSSYKSVSIGIQRMERSDSNSGMNSKLVLDKKFHGIETKSVWNMFFALNAQLNPIDLAIGFPNYLPEQNLLQELSRASDPNCSPLIHQYARPQGHPRLVNALAALYGPLIGRQINPLTEILISVGALGSMYNAIMAFVGKGDEVIIIEPFFDRYEPLVLFAGGTPVYVPLRPKQNAKSSEDWKLDMTEFEKVFNHKTKAIILNNPNNPLGKVFSRQELMEIAELCKKHDVLVISDEVYDWLVYDNKKHVRIAELEGMWERTITIGSAGKMFSLTGWRIGWAYGSQQLIQCLEVAHQNSTLTIATPLQEAVGSAIELEIEQIGRSGFFLQKLASELKEKRDTLASSIQDLGMIPVVPEGGYFMLANWRLLEPHLDLSSETDDSADYRFSKCMVKSWKILSIPPSAFYSNNNKHIAEDYVRFCFFKKTETLQSADKIFKEWKQDILNANNRVISSS